MPAVTSQLFVSYAREDAAFALKLATDLRARGTHLWVDQLDIRAGTAWDSEVEKALRASPAMLVILSPASVASQNVMDEVAFAISEAKWIVPVLYKPCSIPLRLRRLQHIELVADYDKGLQRLIDELLASTAPHSVVDAPTPMPTPEPPLPLIRSPEPAPSPFLEPTPSGQPRRSPGTRTFIWLNGRFRSLSSNMRFAFAVSMVVIVAGILLRRTSRDPISTVATSSTQATATEAHPPPTSEPPPERPDSEALPDALQILSTFREAIGGESAIKKHSSRTVTGIFELPLAGTKGDVRIVAAAPNRMKMTISLPGVGNLERGYDGKIGYSIDPVMGPRLIEGPELEELKYSADFYDDLHDMSKYASAVVVSKGIFEGEECYEVKLVRPSGFTRNEFFSVKTGLLHGAKMNPTSDAGTIPVTTTLSDYKSFGGVMIATVARQKLMGLDSVTTITNVSFEPVDAKALALPEAVAPLTRQAK
jgi:hypothetical protein